MFYLELCITLLTLLYILLMIGVIIAVEIEIIK